MKLKLILLSITPLFAINCEQEISDSGEVTLTCDDLDQNLSGIEYFNFKQFNEDVQNLKLKLNDDVQNINVGYKNLLKTALDTMRESLTQLSLVHFNNDITNDILKSAPNLKQFNMVKTDLTELPDSLFEDTDITYFKILESQLETLNSKVFKNSNLEKIRIEKSKISKLESDAFIHTPELETLDLSDNNIESVDLEVLKHLTELRKLHLDNNGLTELPEKFLWRNTKLKSLSLSGNKLENLPCELLKHHYSLTSLNITRNNFSTIPCHVITRQGQKLVELDASENQIHKRYNKDLSHKRGVSYKLSKKLLKAQAVEEKRPEGIKDNICDVCDRLPPRKRMKMRSMEHESETL